MWRHLVAAAAAIAITLIALNFWGNFGGAMTRVVKIRAERPMPVSVITEAADAGCAGRAPCPPQPGQTP